MNLAGFKSFQEYLHHHDSAKGKSYVEGAHIIYVIEPERCVVYNNLTVREQFKATPVVVQAEFDNYWKAHEAQLRDQGEEDPKVLCSALVVMSRAMGLLPYEPCVKEAQ